MFRAQCRRRGFPVDPVVKNSPCNAGDVSLIPGQGTKILHSVGQLSPWATTTEPSHHIQRVHSPQQEVQDDATKTPSITTKTRCSQINKSILTQCRRNHLHTPSTFYTAAALGYFPFWNMPGNFIPLCLHVSWFPETHSEVGLYAGL